MKSSVAAGSLGRTTIAPAPAKRRGKLQFYSYAVEGMLGGERKLFHVVCCHAADARGMIAKRLPNIGDLKVRRGKPVHGIAIGGYLSRR